MPVGPPNSAPYDSLATVTSLVRTILADYIQGLVPNPQGVANVNGVNLTWVSGRGPQFSIYFNGAPIQVNGLAYAVFAVTSPTTLVLTAAVPGGPANNVPWSATIQTGEIFADTQAYVVPTVNLGWRKLQKKLADKGHPRLESEVDILGLPVVTNLDPISQQSISWTGFFDGTALQNLPTLPPDFISPLRFWERPSVPFGTPNFNRLRPMRLAPDALRSCQKGSWNRYWDWREDAVYFPGSIIPMDFRARYSAFLPDLAAVATAFGTTPVPIMRCADPLAYYTAAEFVNPRGGLLGTTFEAKGDVLVDQITNSSAKLQQRSSYSRIAWGGRGRRRAGLR